MRVSGLSIGAGGGLALNISKEDNSQSLDLVRSVAPKPPDAQALKAQLVQNLSANHQE